MSLEKDAHPKTVFLIKNDTKAIIYPEVTWEVNTSIYWVLSIGEANKGNGWRKVLGKYPTVESAVHAAKDFGFSSVHVRHVSRTKTWSRRILRAERSWRQVYIDRNVDLHHRTFQHVPYGPTHNLR